MNAADFFRLVRNRFRITDGTKIDPRAIDKDGSNAQLLMVGLSTMAEAVEARSVSRDAAFYTASAVDADLDRDVGEWTFQRLPRKGAAAAQLVLQVYRTGAGTLGGTIPKGTIVLAGGLRYALDEDMLWTFFETSAKLANFTCTTLGTVGNVSPDQIGTFDKPAALFDPNFVAIPYNLVSEGYGIGGAERENDNAYRARLAAFDAGLDRDDQWFVSHALSVPGVTYAVAIEDVDALGLPVGSVTLYLADVNGRANLALIARVRAAMRGWRLLGQDVPLVGASPTLVPFVLHFAVTSGFDITQTQATARAAVVAAVNALGPGATLYLALVESVLLAIPGVAFDTAAGAIAAQYGVISPAADIAPSGPSTLFRTTVDLVTFA